MVPRADVADRQGCGKPPSLDVGFPRLSNYGNSCFELVRILHRLARAWPARLSPGLLLQRLLHAIQG